MNQPKFILLLLKLYTPTIQKQSCALNSIVVFAIVDEIGEAARGGFISRFVSE